MRRVGGVDIRDAVATPSVTPGAGKALLYVKSNGLIYTKDSTGAEREVVDLASAQTMSNKNFTGTTNFASTATVGATAGGHVLLDATGIQARNGAVANGHLYLNDTSTGRVYLGKGGNLSVGSSGSDLGGGATGSDQVNTAAGYLRLNWETSNPVAIGGAGTTTLVRGPLDIGGNADVTGALIATGEVYGSQARVGAQAGANTVLSGNHLYARNGASNNGTLNLNVSITAPVVIGTNGYATTLNTNALTYPNFPTAGTANASLTAGGVLQRISSSRRYKDNIRDLDVDVEAALELRPRQYQRNDRTDVLKFTDADGQEHHELCWFPVDESSPLESGFIAEEADALGLTAWVEYNDAGEPDGFFYMNWIAVQQAVLREHRDRITELEARNSTLEARLAALEARVG